MDSITVVVAVSTFTAGTAVAVGGIGPARGLGEALAKALEAIARQPEAAGQITRTLFVGMALIESVVIYAFVIGLIILFANPLMGYIVK
ncbi:MAG TPA: ATP synthase F0 subunit C [Geobacteraceae bacterium]|nr:ATP synthase F0 subunit C [Geobacteraceae bacterium]